MSNSRDRVDGIMDNVTWSQAASSRQILLEGDAPGKTLELASNAMGFASHMILRMLDAGGKTPACQKGCSFCCHVLVEATVPEILTLAEAIRAIFTDEERDRLVRAIEAHIEATAMMTKKDRLASRLPCPLLRDGSCSAYGARPLACRGWHSFDVERCREDFEHPGGKDAIPLNGMALASGRAVWSGLQVALRSRRLDDRTVELARGLKIALEDPSLVATWRSRPEAFDAAVTSKIYPDPAAERTESKAMDRAYRLATNRPEWNGIGARDQAEPPAGSPCEPSGGSD